MRGLIVSTFEKFLYATYGRKIVEKYRKEYEKYELPLPSKIYEEEVFFTATEHACSVLGIEKEKILMGFGIYFMTDTQTQHILEYLLKDVFSTKEAILSLHRIFNFFYCEIHQLHTYSFAVSCNCCCYLLKGILLGCAKKYHEDISMYEQTCIEKGASICRFVVQLKNTDQHHAISLDTKKRLFIQTLLLLLPSSSNSGISVIELSSKLSTLSVYKHIRPFFVLEHIQQLEYAGIVESDNNILGKRRYWKIV